MTYVYVDTSIRAHMKWPQLFIANIKQFSNEIE